MDPSVKNYHWLDLDLALLETYDHDADLVVLRDPRPLRRAGLRPFRTHRLGR